MLAEAPLPATATPLPTRHHPQRRAGPRLKKQQQQQLLLQLLTLPLLLLLLLLAAARVPGARAAPLATVNAIADLWSGVSLSAAEATLAAIERQTGARGLSLWGVPLDTLRVFTGQTHHLGVELGGVEFDLLLSSSPLDQQQQQREQGERAYGSGSPQEQPTPPRPAPALPASQVPSSAAAGPAATLRRDAVLLPEVTLAGPVELVLPRVMDVDARLPHSAQARARRLLVAPGVAVTLRGLRAVALRRPVDMPALPRSYVAEVYATLKLGGQAEPGYERAPGMRYLSRELYRRAVNASLGRPFVSGDGEGGGGGGEGGSEGWGDADAITAAAAASGRRPRPRLLLSFDVEPAGEGVTLLTARQPGERAAPRLRLRRAKAPAAAGSSSSSSSSSSSTLEVVLRDADAAAAAAAAAEAAAAPDGVAPGELAPEPWAWPLPCVADGQWMPYEALLRSALAAGDMRVSLLQGAPLRLTRSALRGAALLSFEMTVRAPAPAGGAGPLVDLDGGLEEEEEKEEEDGSSGSGGSSGGGGALEVWEAVVEVREAPEAADGSSSGGSGSSKLVFVPVSSRRKASYASTLTLSPSALALAAGAGNVSRPLGTESHDLGVARAAAAAGGGGGGGGEL